MIAILAFLAKAWSSFQNLLDRMIRIYRMGNVSHFEQMP